jgi:plasmid stabilization system protein ParE
MSASIGYHPLVQKDLNQILAYYESEVGPEIADRFESEFRLAIAAIRNAPRHFPFYQSQRIYRRCLLASFPHVILFREAGSHVRIMVLKHVKRAPGFGLRRH